MRTAFLVVAILCSLASVGLAQNKREQAVREDRKNLKADESWIYDDLEEAMAEAKAKQKPIMVLIRCLP
jgi:hypothetical protein